VDIYEVDISKSAVKELKKVPSIIVDKLQSWIEAVELRGLREVRKLPSFHDEPLKGKRKGQRSIRLNKAYRAIYTIKKDTIEFVLIEEVNKHDY
jgi:proteic killer suppression protein